MRIMLTDCDHATMQDENNVFAMAGLSYEHFQCSTEKDVIATCKGGEVLMHQYAPMTRQVMEALLPELKMIVRYGVGLDNVDLAAAEELGVIVCNVPDYGMNEVADQAVAMLLALQRKVCFINSLTKAGEWDYSAAIPIHRIPGSIVGIVGLGRIGRTFAKRMSGFDCQQIAYDPRFKEGDIISGVRIVDFDTLLRESDLISIHCPLTGDTRGLFGRDAFAKMKPSSYLVNTARGGIVDENALYEALVDGQIAGAALDVMEKEPMYGNSPLLTLDSFICTPHIAWYSEEAACELKRKVALEAVRYAQGEPLHYAQTCLGRTGDRYDE